MPLLKAQLVWGIMNQMSDHTAVQEHTFDKQTSISSENFIHSPNLPISPTIQESTTQKPLLQSTPVQVLLTGFLLISLFSASFLVAYQHVERTKASESIDKIPEAEIILPPIMYSPTPTQDWTCGGISGEVCMEGYKCLLESELPDANGVCVID